MPIPLFDRVHKSTNLGLSRFAMWLPILLRVGLLLLFIWYGIELFLNATGFGPKSFLVLLGSLFLLIFVTVMGRTYSSFLKTNDATAPSSTSPIWPFILINVFMILLVSAIFKWERGRGAEDVTRGLLGFTWYWVQKLGGLLTGGR
jgi:hypothetical protein